MPREQDDTWVLVETDPDGRYHRKEDLLGEGSFWCVYKAFDSATGIDVAWNQVKIMGRLSGNMEQSLVLLQKVRHESMLECFHFWEDETRQHVNVITELAGSGTLKSFAERQRVDLEIVCKWARQILSALNYLHTNFIIYRDLNCDSIFINENLEEAKLGNIALHALLSEMHAQHHTHSFCTPEFMAPELFEEQYTEKVDVYAFGMCILAIFTSEAPYSECISATQVYKKMAKGLPPSALDKIENIAVKHFIEQCLAPEVDRPSAKALLQHELLMEDASVPGPTATGTNLSSGDRGA